MKATRSTLPVAALLHAYRSAGPPSLEELLADPRWQAIADARQTWLNDSFLDQASDEALSSQLSDFYRAVVALPVHPDQVRERVRLVRHGINHLLRCPDPVADKVRRCVATDGPYFVPGLGLSFWAAVAQACDVEHNAGWTTSVWRGLVRLGLVKAARPASFVDRYARAFERCRRLSTLAPDMPAWRVNHFLNCVAAMRGRELPVRLPPGSGPVDSGSPLVVRLAREVRTRTPLRRRVKEWGAAVRQSRDRLEQALSVGDAAGVVEAVTAVCPMPLPDGPERLLDWAARLWRSPEPLALLETIFRDGSTATIDSRTALTILYLRDAQQFPLWDGPSRHGYAHLDDGFDPADEPASGYRLFAAGVAELCRRHRLHRAELPDLLARAERHAHEFDSEGLPEAFGGFCSDTFRFLDELDANNQRAWMELQRDRYRFAVREPMVELCRLLAERYVEPVLNGELGLGLVTEARTGKALTSIVKNDYGQTVPYQPVLWVTFYRHGPAGKRADAQFFVRLDRSGLTYGFHLGRSAREAGKRFRRNVQEHGDLLFRALDRTGARKACSFRADESAAPVPVRTAGDLRAWAVGKSLYAERHVPVGSPALGSDDLAGEVLMTFDQLLPAYLCAAVDEPRTLLEERYRLGAGSCGFDREAFQRSTHLPASWLDRALSLLEMKKQLILQGVPGTGKTHVAGHLARLLTGDRAENVRLVQFHPSFSYEEFVEGIKARTVETDGRHEVTYPVEEGVLCAFAARAAARPAEPHVLLIDEINRGNLPRIFGELLYLLEYRDRSLTLPYSRREFRLPTNLYLIGTMNSADRSVTLIDQALRRRFSFLEMPPDARALAAWLEAHPPRGDEGFGQRLVRLFETLNEKLAADFGPHFQVGHSYFMLPDLDEDKLRTVWEHHVRPVLEEYAGGQAGRLADYQLDRLIGRSARRHVRPGI